MDADAIFLYLKKCQGCHMKFYDIVKLRFFLICDAEFYLSFFFGSGKNQKCMIEHVFTILEKFSEKFLNFTRPLVHFKVD